MRLQGFFISAFLKEFKEHVVNGKLLLVRREKNFQTLIDLGLNYENFKDFLLSLTIENFSSGPDPNEEYPGFIMVFGKTISGHEIYIKITNTDKTGIQRRVFASRFILRSIR